MSDERHSSSDFPCRLVYSSSLPSLSAFPVTAHHLPSIKTPSSTPPDLLVALYLMLTGVSLPSRLLPTQHHTTIYLVLARWLPLGSSLYWIASRPLHCTIRTPLSTLKLTNERYIIHVTASCSSHTFRASHLFQFLCYRIVYPAFVLFYCSSLGNRWPDLFLLANLRNTVWLCSCFWLCRL